ncbi:MAG: Uma2 family endonuclease [Solirubrobacterales bacterium]|nr:Uma2 family endonuclease [Solirubrobacterales bacterium]
MSISGWPQQLAVLLDPLARAAGLEAVAGGVNLGDEDSYRIPDASLHQRSSGGTYVSSAALVVEIRSPGDDTEIPFYAERGVEEVLIVDPRKRQVEWLGLRPDGGYERIAGSRLIEAGPDTMAHKLDWPG